MATNWMGNFNYQGGGMPTPQQNLQNARGIADKVKAGSSFGMVNGQWQEVDMWGNPVNGTPAATPPANQQAGPSDTPNTTTTPEPPQKKYGGVTGGYGSGDPVETVKDPAEIPPEKTGSNVTPDGGPAKPAFVPIKIAAGTSYTPRSNGGRGQILDRFGGMELTEEMLAGVPETDLAKLREAAAKGPGAFKEFMKLSASAPWYKQVSDAISTQLKSTGGFRKRDGSGGGGPANINIGPGNQRNMQDYAPAWMQKRRAENEAKRSQPVYTTMPLYPDQGMQFIDKNQDGIDDRTQGQAGGGGWQPDPNYGIPPGSQWDTPEWKQFMEIKRQQEAGGMQTGWYPPWLVNQNQGGPQQNPPFDPRILQMLMGGQYNG